MYTEQLIEELRNAFLIHGPYTKIEIKDFCGLGYFLEISREGLVLEKIKVEEI